MTVRPVRLEVAPPVVVGGAGAFIVTVYVDGPEIAGGYAQVACSRPNLVVSPTGFWPYRLYYPPGSRVGSLVARTRPVAASAAIEFVACSDGTDVSDPGAWEAFSDGTVLASAA